MTDMTRRRFLTTVTRGSVSVALVGIAACTTESTSVTTTTVGQPAVPTSPDPIPSTTSTTEEQTPNSPRGSWSRVSLGSVSAYLFARDGEAILIDTGRQGSIGDIGDSLTALGLGFADLSTIIATHLHSDHVGSLPDVMNAAPEATGYAGAPDLPAISSPRPLQALSDGDRVFGLEVIATPGHTPGHIALLDPVGGVLAAGDSLNGGGGGVVGPNSRFTPDMDTANQSVIKLAGFEYEVIYFGHGEPVASDGSAQVAELSSDL